MSICMMTSKNDHMTYFGSSKICSICKHRKSLEAFLIEDPVLGAIYSGICSECRNKMDEDEGGGGKQDQLTIDVFDRDARLKEQKEKQEEIDEGKEEYKEELDEEKEEDKELAKEEKHHKEIITGHEGHKHEAHKAHEHHHEHHGHHEHHH